MTKIILVCLGKKRAHIHCKQETIQYQLKGMVHLVHIAIDLHLGLCAVPDHFTFRIQYFANSSAIFFLLHINESIIK